MWGSISTVYSERLWKELVGARPCSLPGEHDVSDMSDLTHVAHRRPGHIGHIMMHFVFLSSQPANF